MISDNPDLTQRHYKDHDVRMERGEPFIECHKTGKRHYNTVFIKSRVCPDCGKLKLNGNADGSAKIAQDQLNEQIKSDSLADSSNGSSSMKTSTRIICDKCSQVMEETSANIFYCVNGHKKALVNLVEAKTPEQKPEKRKRVIQERCPYCGNVAEVISESKIKDKIFRKYSCGHSVISDVLAVPTGRDQVWNKLFEFQRSGVEFVENANYRAQIGDEMGLGKTIQALATLRYNYDQLTPCLMICESSKVYDWKKEFNDWVSDKFNEIRDEPIIHRSGKDIICPGFKNHIISMSLLQKPKVLKSILSYGFKFIIVDESHSFKNEGAERTYALQQIAKEIPHILFLSGTPIMNKVMEYFVPLNILRPSHFPSKDWLANRCDKSSSGRILGLSNWYRPRFFNMIEDYVIRRTKKDAGIKLPEIRINKHIAAINENKDLVKEYNKILDELEDIINKRKEDVGMTSDLLGLFAKLRHITGLGKIKPIIAQVEEFLESTDPTDKITIGVHHKDVMSYLAKGLAEYHPICISDESPEIKMQRIAEFERPERRVMIASILGAGQGLNLQFCKNAIVMEREWNPAKEDQFMGRFHRIVKNEDGSLKTEFSDAIDSVTIDIFNAKDTIDEFFDELLELKNHIVGSTLAEEFAYDPEFLLELARKMVATRMRTVGA